MPVLTNLQVCCLVAEIDVSQTKSNLENFLPQDRYTVTIISDLDYLVSLLTKPQNTQDCLVIFRDVDAVVDHLGMLKVFMPTILVLEDFYEQSEPYEQSESKDFYRASISISSDQLQDLPTIIDQAIATFIKISPQVRHQVYVNIPDIPVSESLSVQQQRLANRKEYIGRLKNIYRSIILEYFSETNNDLNKKIDEFVNLSFFADISVSQVLEIHMELMDEFAKQLRLEGRNDEILLDYRIALIDMIAHLCELYRCSIPRT